MAENVDLISFGKHCHVKDCKNLEHRTASSHQCPRNYVTDVQVPVCPLCGQMVKKSRHQDANVQVAYHIQSGCKELVVNQKVKKEGRCSFKGCKKHEMIPFTCDQCHRQFCVRHRHAQDHLCHGNILYPVVTCA
ncbi:AN1-type zinc finger protein 2A-like isoform X2 [Xenia sp. Carnegie-2017]|uniref:AN1-type zinc finger protein 2A-like isoform X2 n=1 Tax=Xenia sp. Carnegie-2017 TaxID=2897299 RepID=UPI001F0462E6|nr:AN1-type zinc finger protein 2A-like isoform X2 [Xenia sp. Carnegie-2017]